MQASWDLVVRNATIADGTGRPVFAGDVAIQGGRIAAVGEVAGTGREEIDAAGKLVTPGFVDIHTHYDGHVTWTDRLSSSSAHGVTTVLMGNCGVGFAPCRPEHRASLVQLMEGIEDIPEIVLTEGLPWDWESFPDYLDRVAQRRYDIDVAFQLPHAPLRVFVMGERALAREPATPADIAAMRALACEAVQAGALGFSTSRSVYHQATDGRLTPTYDASGEELAGIALGLRDADRGVLQLATDFSDMDGDFRIIRQVVGASGRPLSISVSQTHGAPDRWRRYLDEIERAVADGLPVKAQVANRPVGMLLGLRLPRNPFMRTPTWRALEHAPLTERIRRLKDDAVRRRILAEAPGDMSPIERALMAGFESMYEFKGDYEPAAAETLGARAAAQGTDAMSLAYDVLAAGDGEAILCQLTANFAGHDAGALAAMLQHDQTIFGLGDAGAHLGMIFDASMTTYMLERWSNAGRGAMPVERAVQALTRDTAQAVGLRDRGVLAPGYRADLNVIDVARLAISRPYLVGDLPAGRRRIHQSASGYDATIVAGEVTYRDGVATGALPGRLVRGGQSAHTA
jgi:N-acyl-D-aspartate/D-glutamate deacylase